MEENKRNVSRRRGNISQTLSLQPYGIALAAVLIALLAGAALEPLAGPWAAYILCFAAVMFGAWWGGSGAGLAATCVSATALTFFFVESMTVLPPGVPSPLIAIAIYLAAGMLVSALSHALIHIPPGWRHLQPHLVHIFDSVGDGILMMDRQWRLTFANQEVERIVQRDRHELIGCILWDTFPEAVGTHFYHACHEAMATHEPRHLEYFITPYQLWLEMHAYPSPDGLLVYFRDITARKHAEEHMRFQAHVLAHMRDVVIAVDTDERITYWNREAERFFDVRSDEVCGGPLHSIVHYQWVQPDDEQVCEQALRQADTWVGEVVLSAAHGQTAAELSLSVLRDEQGAPVGRLCIIRDMSQRKRADAERLQLLNREQAARVRAETARQRLSFLAEASQELAISLDYSTTLDSLARLAVPTLADWCVVDVLEEQGQIHRVAVAHHDPTREERLAAFHRHQADNHVFPTALHVLQTGESKLIPDVSYYAPDEFAANAHQRDLLSYLGMQSLLVVPLTARGATIGTITLVCSAQRRRYGVDDLVLAEDLAHRAALAVDNARLYHAAQMSRTESSALAGRSTFLAEVSRILATSLNYEATLTEVMHLAVPFLADWCMIDLMQEEHLISRIEAFNTEHPYHRPLQEKPSQLLQHVLNSGMSEFYPEVPDNLRDMFAQEQDVLHSMQMGAIQAAIIVPLIARKRMLGAIICLSTSPARRYYLGDLTLVEDLAHRVALAIDNAHLYQEGQEAIRVRDQFLSIASHELKTPLTSLLGYARLLQGLHQGTTITEREQRGMRIIAEQADRLSKLINALLDISRIRTGRLSIERSSVDLALLTQRVVEEVQIMLEQHALYLTYPDEALVVEGDVLRLEQVLQNLIQNAIKYSPQGGDIHIRLQRQDNYAYVRVIDQGIGIPAEALAHMFQPFYRAPNTETQQIAGMGIGLFVVKEIVMLHGGEVDVVSHEDEGSTFIIRLPLAMADIAVAEPSVALAQPDEYQDR
jgi:PAS domain S-box-containing protein